MMMRRTRSWLQRIILSRTGPRIAAGGFPFAAAYILASTNQAGGGTPWFLSTDIAATYFSWMPLQSDDFGGVGDCAELWMEKRLWNGAPYTVLHIGPVEFAADPRSSCSPLVDDKVPR